MQSSPLQSVTIIGFDRGFFGERDNDHSTKPRFFTASRARFGVLSDKNNPGAKRQHRAGEGSSRW
jgi:hypothetical protein